MEKTKRELELEILLVQTQIELMELKVILQNTALGESNALVKTEQIINGLKARTASKESCHPAPPVAVYEETETNDTTIDYN